MKLISAIFISLALTSNAFAGEINAEKSDSEVFDHATTIQIRAQLIGRWYGEKQLDDESVQKWIVTRQDDGTYVIKFKTIAKDGSVESWVEAGIWGVRSPIYFTAMRSYIENDDAVAADTTDASLYDAYKIVKIDQNSFTYKSYTSGNEYTVKKVANDFEL